MFQPAVISRLMTRVLSAKHIYPPHAQHVCLSVQCVHIYIFVYTFGRFIARDGKDIIQHHIAARSTPHTRKCSIICLVCLFKWVKKKLYDRTGYLHWCKLPAYAPSISVILIKFCNFLLAPKHFDCIASARVPFIKITAFETLGLE